MTLKAITFLSLLIIAVLQASADTRPPNFIIIFTDDQGYQDLGCYGSPDIATPHLDRMASEGMRFTSFYAQTICGPSRTALMTASYPLRVAQDKNRCEIHPVLHADEITIAEVLKPRGYQSAAFGKWDLATHSQSNWIPELLPRGQGFDYFFGTPSSNDRVVHLLRNEEVIERNADMATLTQRYTDEAIQFIERNQDGPFFVYLAHTMPHTLLDASDDFKGKSKAGLYGDVIEEIDHNSGRILDKVRELGLDDNTYIIFTSDNGPWILRKDHGGHALPLRSGKTTCWEGGLRVPCIVRAPGRVPPGTTCDLVAATIDLMPTLARLAGADVPSDRVLDGLDISRIWHGEQTEIDRSYFYYQHYYLRGVRQGDWKLMLRHEEGPGSFTARWNRHVASDDAKPLTSHLLFNLKDDIGETTDLAAQHPEKVTELLELAEQARGDIGDFDRIGKNARFFDDGPNRLSPAKPAPNRDRQQQSSRIKPTGAANPSPRRPNFVVILTDDQGYGDLSCYGGTHIDTPSIDQMAAEGAKLTSFYVAAPVCTPSRAALMTGCYPKRINMATGSNFGVLLAGDRKGLNPDEITIAEVLKSAGYRTGMFGKWHLGDQPEFLPTRQGFDEFFGIPYSHDIHPFHPRQAHYNFPPLPLLDGERVIEMDPDADFLTKRITERAVKFIEKNKDDPFFLYIPHPIPHAPLHVSPPFMEGVTGETLAMLDEEDGNIAYQVRHRLFRQAIAEIDWSVGQILGALKAAQIDENTFVLFTSDNGPPKNTLHASPGILRGHKGTTLEGGMREPTVARWPGTIPAGIPNDELMTAMDLLPTFAKLAGVELPTDRTIDGKDVSAVLRGKATTPHEKFFYHRGAALQAVRSGKWKLHWNKGKPTQLYDLETDIAEKNDLIKREPELVERLVGYMKAFEQEIAKNSRPAGLVENPRALSK